MKITEDLTLFQVVDDCLFLAKSKEEILEYYKNEFGEPEILLNISEQEFLDNIVPLNEDLKDRQIRVKDETDDSIIETKLKDYALMHAKDAPHPLLWLTS